MLRKQKSKIKISAARFCVCTLTETALNLVGHLHKIASYLFIIPASSASIERTFSVAKLLTDGLRNRTSNRLLNNKLTVYLNRDIK